MAQSLSAVYIQAVFSTKNRTPWLSDADLRKEVFAYLAGVSKKLDCQPIAIDGTADHVHILVRFGKETTISNWIKEIKRNSSSFAKERLPEFAWQSGYAVFSIDAPRLDTVARYIRNQEEHHKAFDFQNELRQLMTEHGLEWDERYFWD